MAKQNIPPRKPLVITDPKEFAFKKKAYDDSLAGYNSNKISDLIRNTSKKATFKIKDEYVPSQYIKYTTTSKTYNQLSASDKKKVDRYKTRLAEASKNVEPITFKKGGAMNPIHIKPENRGKFTAYKERTGKTTEEALHSPNAHVRQMANFARNAAKWKHAMGGELDNILPTVPVNERRDMGIMTNPWLYTYDYGIPNSQVVGGGFDMQHRSGLHGGANLELPLFNKNAEASSSQNIGISKNYKDFYGDLTLMNDSYKGSPINPSAKLGLGYSKNLGDHYNFNVGVENTMSKDSYINPSANLSMTYHFANGGKLNDTTYTYDPRPGVRYKKDEQGNWYINHAGTKNEYVKIEDPTGKRTKELNANAINVNTNKTPHQEHLEAIKASKEYYKKSRPAWETQPQSAGSVDLLPFSANKPDSDFENIVEIVDPTGITSWDDVAESKSTGETILNSFGALPIVGNAKKLTTLAKTTKATLPKLTTRQLNSFNTAVKGLETFGKYAPITGKGVDTYQAVQEYALGGNLNYPNSNYASEAGMYYANGGQFTQPYSLPEDSFKQGGRNLHNSIYASSPQQYPAVYKAGGSLLSMSNTPQLEGAKKDLSVPENAYIYQNGGNMYPQFTNILKSGNSLDGLVPVSYEVGGQLTEFNEGGSHEENPLGGIPQGVASNGGLNLVEEGETKLDSANYIFSDTLKVDSETAKGFGFPSSYVGKTFADVSKKLNRPNSRRENDTIEEVAKKRDLDALMGAQEDFKAKEVEKKKAEIMALDPTALGTPNPAPQPQMPQGMEQPQEGQPAMDPQAMMMQQMGQPQLPGMRMGGNMYAGGGLLAKNPNTAEGALSGAMSGAMLGSKILPGYGTLIGGIGGLIAGGIGGHKQDVADDKLKEEEDAYMMQQKAMNNQIAMQSGQLPWLGKNGGYLGQQMYEPLDHVTEMGGFLDDNTDDYGSLENYLISQHEKGLNSTFATGGGLYGNYENPADLQSMLETAGINPDSFTQTSEGNNDTNPPSTESAGSTEGNAANSITRDTDFESSLTDEERIALNQELANAKTTEEADKIYKSALARHDETLKDKNIDLTMNQTWDQALGQMVPVAYNVGKGIFGKTMDLNPEDYSVKTDIKPWMYNADPELGAVRNAYASAEAGLKNTLPGAGAYLTNRSNLANSEADATKQVLANKQNIDAQNYMAAVMANKQLEAGNMATKANIDQLNRQARNNKQEMLKTGLGQLADISRNSVDMDAQMKLLQVMAPDYANTLKYNTVMDQLATRYATNKAARKAAEEAGKTAPKK